MIVLLVLILIVSTISMVFNVAYILHELGWFPHGKRRDIPTSLLTVYPFASPGKLTGEDEAVNFNTDGTFAMALRLVGHPDVYTYDDPVLQLRRVLDTYVEQPTPGHEDDLIHLLNTINASGDVPDGVDDVAEDIYRALADQERRTLEVQRDLAAV